MYHRISRWYNLYFILISKISSVPHLTRDKLIDIIIIIGRNVMHMKFYDEFKEEYVNVDIINAEPNMEQYENKCGTSFDDAEDNTVLIGYFEWMGKNDYSHLTIRRYYKSARLYTQFVNKKLGKSFETEGLVDVMALYRNTDLAYLFFEDILRDIEDEIDSWIENRNEYDDYELLSDYFVEFKAVISLLWFGFHLGFLPSIHRDDIDLEKHTVCGVHIYNNLAWNCIKEQYYNFSYHRIVFNKLSEIRYIDNGYLFKHRTKPRVISEPVTIRSIQNNLQTVYNMLDIPRLASNDITLFGFMSRFIGTEHGLDNIYLNKEALFEYITDNIKTNDRGVTIFNKKYVYDKFELYRIKLLKYLVKAVDIESKL